MSSTCQSCRDRAGCREVRPTLDAGDLWAGGARTAELDSTGDKVARARWLRECVAEASLSAQLRVERVSRLVVCTLGGRGSVEVGRLRRRGIVRLLLQSGCKRYE
jgi:hypothetical protein